MGRSKLTSTIATIITTSCIALGIAGGAVAIHALKQNTTPESQNPGSDSQSDNHNNNNKDAKGIDRIEKTNTFGLVDEYTIYYTDGTNSKFIVTNGADGAQGIQGYPGTDGVTPTIEISNNDTWVINGTDTGVTARGQQGPAGSAGTSLLADNGAPANDLGNNGDSYINLSNGDYYVKENDSWVLKNNIKGQPGEEGVGIASVEKTDTTGLVDTYTITYSDSTNENPHTQTFTVTNGEEGNKIIVGSVAPTDAISANVGDNYLNVADWHYYVLTDTGWDDKGSIKGEEGVSIVSVEKTSTNELVDTYTITYSDSTNENPHTSTFAVTNGKNGTSVKTGHRDPRAVNDDPTTPQDETLAAVEGIEGDSYVDLDTWNYFVLTDDGEGNLSWNPEGNLHYSPNKYTVTFATDGGDEVDPIVNTPEGFTITAPVEPIKRGYYFQGWYTVDGTRWDFSKDVVTSDTTLTARWGRFIIENGIITSCSIDTGDVVIPDFYEGELVTGLGNYLFFSEPGITSVTIPHTVKSIGNGAFEGCTGLTSIVIPNSVRTIGDEAFKDCSNIVYAYIEDPSETPSGALSRIAPRAAVYASGLNTVGESAFEGCSKLEAVYLPNSVTSLGKNAYVGCTELKAYTAPFIGGGTDETAFISYAFGGESYLDNATKMPYYIETITITGDQNIKENALRGTECFNNIIISGHPESIGLGAFQDIPYLNNVTVPFVGGSLNNNAFFAYVFGATSRESTNATEVPSLDTVTVTSSYKIENYGFAGCNYIRNIKFTEDLIQIGSHAFSHCSGLRFFAVPNTVRSIGYYAFEYCEDLTEITLPSNEYYNTIGEGMFSHCTNLLWVHIPSNVWTIDNYAFDSCTYLKSIDIPDSVTTIGHHAFANCTSLKSVALPSRIYNVGESMFEGCTSLEAVYIPNGVTTIPQKMFKDCSSLANIAIPDSVTSIKSNAFNGCTSMTSITLPNFSSTLSTIFGGSYPASLKTVVVKSGTEVPSSAFSSCYTLETIVLPDGITSIGQDAFKGCTALVNINLPDGIETINENAFENCTSLKAIVIPDSVETIKGLIFKGCTSIESISMPVAFNAYGRYITEFAYYFNSTADNEDIPESLKAVTISSGTQIRYGFLENCTHIQYVILPEELTSIGRDMFKGCTSLKNLVIPSGVTSIGEYLLTGCNNLETLATPIYGTTSNSNRALSYFFYTGSGNDAENIPESLHTVVINGGTSIPYSYFEDDLHIVNVTVLDGITSIGHNAFDSCASLTRVVLPDSITSFGDAMFINCPMLTDVRLPQNSSLTLLPNNTFNQCASLTEIVIPNTYTELGTYVFYQCTSLTNVVIPTSVTKIGGNLFNGCTSLKEVVIPNSVTTIAAGIFAGCSAIEKVEVPYASKGTSPIYNFSYLFTSLGYTVPTTLKTVIINGDMEIKSNTFLYAPNVETLIITGNVTSIASNGLSGMTSLKTLVLPDTLQTIGNGAFSNCRQLTSITLPEGVTSIGSSAFNNCSSLRSVSIPDGVTSISSSLFSGCSSLTEVKFPNNSSITSIPSYLFQNCSSLSSVTIPSTVTTIGTYAFYKSGITRIVIPNGVTSIGYYAFNECRNLVSVTIPNSVTSIGSQAFTYCESLTIVNLPANAEYTETSSYLFGYCTSLRNITIPENVTTIGENTFKNCTSLTSIYIPNSVTTIKTSAFEGCSNLMTVRIHSGLTTIENDAFKGCDFITTVIYSRISDTASNFATYISSFTSTGNETLLANNGRFTIISRNEY